MDSCRDAFLPKFCNNFSSLRFILYVLRITSVFNESTCHLQSNILKVYILSSLKSLENSSLSVSNIYHKKKQPQSVLFPQIKRPNYKQLDVWQDKLFQITNNYLSAYRPKANSYRGKAKQIAASRLIKHTVHYMFTL